LMAHSGYMNYRVPMLEDGVELYEVRALLGNARGSGESKSATLYGNYALHAKLFVFDRQKLFIGSMNMDRRSAHSNTEVGLIIESRSLARELTLLLQRERIPRSYRLRIANATGGIEWVATLGREQTVQVREPVGDAAVGLGVLLTRSVVPEDWL